MVVNPELTVLLIFATTITIFGHLLRIFELPYFRLDTDSADTFNAMDRYFNSIWCVIITMTTVGYGDMAPSTDFGRLVAMMTALWGTFLISIVVVTVGSVFKLKPK